MIVYANSFQIQAEEGEARDVALDSLRIWLSYGVRRPADTLHFHDGMREEFPDSRTIEAWSTSAEDEDFPRVNAVRFSHPDDSVRGRLWVTEVGIRQEGRGGPAEVSVLLRTNDISTQVAREAVTTSRPRVVQEILSRGRITDKRLAPEVRVVGSDDIDWVREEIDDPTRRHVIVLTSNDDFTDNPPYNLDRLAQQIAGLGRVLHIEDKYDTFRFSQALGRWRSSWNGASNVLFPPRKDRDGFIPSQVFQKSEFQDYQGEGRDGPITILSAITHRTNLPRSWNHISPEDVRAARLRRRLERATKRGVDEETKELLELYDDENDRLEREVKGLRATIEDQEVEIQRQDQELRSLRYRIRALQSTETDDAPAEEEETRFFGTLEEVMAAVQLEFEDHVLLTNRAIRAMKDSPFNDATSVYLAFQFLNGPIWKMLKGDVRLTEVEPELRKAGIEYASSMSDTTMGRSPDYGGTYKGRPADLNRHLKLGTSRDPQRCFRIHFEWDDEEGDELVVVHHAGKHLTTTQS